MFVWIQRHVKLKNIYFTIPEKYETQLILIKYMRDSCKHDIEITLKMFKACKETYDTTTRIRWKTVHEDE